MTKVAKLDRPTGLARHYEERDRIDRLIQAGEALEFRRLMEAARVAGVELSEVDSDSLVAAFKGLKKPFRLADAGSDSTAAPGPKKGGGADTHVPK
jgi:hypothetical protein